MFLIPFGKYKDKPISDIPMSYLEWGKDNMSKVDVKEEFKKEYIRRTSSEVKEKYDPLIFGKDQTENVVNLTVDEKGAHIYKADGSYELKNYKPWALSSQPFNNSIKLKGSQYHKYLTHITYDRYEELRRDREFGKWIARSAEESYMLKNGLTYYKGMTVDSVSLLSFDIEATSLNPKDDNAEVILISNTFRNKKGEIENRLFDIYEYDNQQEMIKAWCSYVREVNPDIMLGHNIFNYDLPYIYECSGQSLELGRKCEEIKFDEHTSRFRKDGTQSYDYYNARIAGRELVDTFFLSIKYDIGRDFPSYGLKRIEEHLDLVDENRIEWDFKKYPTNNYKKWEEGKWEEFKQYCRDDGISPVKMFDIMMPAFFYMTQSVPKTLQQIINEASGSQLDAIMIRSYLQYGYSQPKSSGKAPFEGAISMGNPGVYENVRKVDVASLYPSIMLDNNIYDKKKDPKANMIKALTYFRDERLRNKKLTQETGEKYYDDLQASQKIFINSLYGFMGAGYLLYNYPEGAAEVTRRGREILQIGVEWATGFRLEKVIKKIINEGKPNEKKKYHWVIGEKISEGKGFQLVNVDTDSFSYTTDYEPTKENFKMEIDELNSLYSDIIVWEDDDVFRKVIVVAAKNYILQKHPLWCKEKDYDESGKIKIKYKGSSLTDQKKEPILIEFLQELIAIILVNNVSYPHLKGKYLEYCRKALEFKDLNKWLVKKTVTSSVLSPERSHEQKVLDAINMAIDNSIIDGIQEGDKVWLYQAIHGEKQKVEKGELVFLKDGTPKMVENTVLVYPELFNNDQDKWHYVKRVHSTLEILSNIVDMSKFKKYHNKSNRGLLE